ncbi:unnamed protein product [Prunus brigantina]
MKTEIVDRGEELDMQHRVAFVGRQFAYKLHGLMRTHFVIPCLRKKGWGFLFGWMLNFDLERMLW